MFSPERGSERDQTKTTVGKAQGKSFTLFAPFSCLLPGPGRHPSQSSLRWSSPLGSSFVPLPPSLPLLPKTKSTPALKFAPGWMDGWMARDGRLNGEGSRADPVAARADDGWMAGWMGGSIHSVNAPNRVKRASPPPPPLLSPRSPWSSPLLSSPRCLPLTLTLTPPRQQQRTNRWHCCVDAAAAAAPPSPSFLASSAARALPWTRERRVGDGRTRTDGRRPKTVTDWVTD